MELELAQATMTERPTILGYIRAGGDPEASPHILSNVLPIMKDGDRIICGINLYMIEYISVCMGCWSFINPEATTKERVMGFKSLFSALPSIAKGQGRNVIQLNLNPSLEKLAKQAGYEIQSHKNVQAWGAT